MNEENDEQREINIHNPFDKFFKVVFSNPEISKDLLQKHFPKEIVEMIDFNRFSLTNKSFLNEEFAEKHSDLVFKSFINGQEGYLYLILEHQSSNDDYMPLRFLEYNACLIRQHMKENKTHKAPVILKLCVYNGSEPFDSPKNLLEMFENPDAAQALMFNDYYLVDH